MKILPFFCILWWRGGTMIYKLTYRHKQNPWRNGLYSEFEDLVRAMFKENNEYKYFLKTTNLNVSFEDFLQRSRDMLSKLIEEAKADGTNVIQTDDCRIELWD